MPELPEVEVLVRYLEPLLINRVIRSVQIHRPKSIRPTALRQMSGKLVGAKFKSVTRRAKYLLFEMKSPGRAPAFTLLGHLGMTGRMYLQSKKKQLPKHTAVVLELGRHNFVFEDTRYFGRLTLDMESIDALGPEPLGNEFDGIILRDALSRSTQAIKVKLLDQSVVAGIGNIYASEILFHAGISPRKAAKRLTHKQCDNLTMSIHEILSEAIQCGSTVPLNFSGTDKRDGHFYYGRAESTTNYSEERMLVYGREGDPCSCCGKPVRRIIQSGRSTFFCRVCQRD